VVSEPVDVVPKNPLALTGAQKRALRGQGHHLDALVQVGKLGITDALIAFTQLILEQHELVKISVNAESPLDRKTAPLALADRVGAHVAQVIGRTALLYRRRFEAPTVTLPGRFEEAPRPEPEPVAPAPRRKPAAPVARKRTAPKIDPRRKPKSPNAARKPGARKSPSRSPSASPKFGK
jgi:RNA-binding protein